MNWKEAYLLTTVGLLGNRGQLIIDASCCPADIAYHQGSSLSYLSKLDYKNLLVTTEVYRQQLWMHEQKTNRIEDRIVSITQPHIRPIVRGKAGSSVEFGAKISASCVDGYVFLDYLSWDNFNESNHLIERVESFKEKTGYYPESVHVDKIYRTRKNRAFCKEKGIRISGVPLGRPPKNIYLQWLVE